MNVGCSFKDTLSLWNTTWGESAMRVLSSPTLLAEVIAIRKATFIERCKRKRKPKGRIVGSYVPKVPSLGPRQV